MTALLASGLALTLAAAWAADEAIEERRQRRLAALGDEVTRRFDQRIMSYAEVLFGLRSLSNLRGDMSDVEFRDYVAHTGVIERFPGAVTMAFARVRPLAVSTAGAGPHGKGPAIGRTLWPTEARLVIDSIEPVAGNEDALGRDLSDDPVRMAAAVEACNSGVLAATAPIERYGGGPGFYLTLAVYDTPEIPRTPPARRRHFQGLVAVIFSSDTVFGPEEDPLIDYDVYDVGLTADPPPPDLSRAVIVHDSPAVKDVTASRGPVRVHDINVGSRRWRVVARARASLAPSFERQIVPGVLAGGTALTLAGTALVSALARSRSRAERLAEEMTAEANRRGRELECANAALHRANEELRAAHESQRRFLRTVSHELQTPLTSIVGFSDLLLSGNPPPGEAAEHLARISRNAATLGRVVADLVQFTQLEGGATSLRLASESLGELTHRVVGQNGLLLNDHLVSVMVEDDVTVVADAQAVTQIMTNLLTNAVKFSPVGGAIRVTVSRGRNTGDVTVEDDGPGISDHEQDRVFEPFFRGSGPEVAATPGMGVGLAVVRELAERMSGEVIVSRGLSGGARLTVRLPLAEI